MGKINWVERVENEEVLYVVKEKRNILQKLKEERLTGLVTSC